MLDHLIFSSDDKTSSFFNVGNSQIEDAAPCLTWDACTYEFLPMSSHHGLSFDHQRDVNRAFVS